MHALQCTLIRTQRARHISLPVHPSNLHNGGVASGQQGPKVSDCHGNKCQSADGMQRYTAVDGGASVGAAATHKHTKAHNVFCSRVSITEKLFSDFALLLHLLRLILLCFNIYQNNIYRH